MTKTVTILSTVWGLFQKRLGVRELGVSATALAERFGMTQPAVSISVKRGEKIAEEMGLQSDNIL